MDKENIKRYLLDFNNRKFKLIERRVGKTYLLFNKIKLLEESGIQRNQIIYFNFESPILSDVSYKEISELIEIQWSIFPDIIKKKIYIFIDEPQAVSKWELAIRDIYDRYNCHIFLTGSSSKLLSKEIATSLRGRSITNLLLPLSFKEFLIFKGLIFDKNKINTEIKSKIINYFEEYLLFGGYPEVVLENDNNEKMKIVKDYFDMVIYKDIVERYNLKNTKLIKWLMNSLINSISKEFSINNLFNTLKSQGIKISKNTLYSYFNIFEDSFFIFALRKFEHSEKKRGLSIPKIYLDDISFLNLFSIQEYGKRLENIVFLQLLRQKNQNPLINISYWKSIDNKEVDFIVTEGKKVTRIIQVCNSLSDENTKKRETKSLIAALKYFNIKEGIIITNEDNYKEEEIEGKKIKIIPLWKLLLEESFKK